MMSEYFSKFGKLESCMLKYSYESGKSLNSGFLSYESDESADKAIK
jgi:RNA recognition motif-containing protein